MTVECVKSVAYALRDAITSETVHNTIKVILWTRSILLSCHLRHAERDLLAIAKFLVVINLLH